MDLEANISFPAENDATETLSCFLKERALIVHIDDR